MTFALVRAPAGRLLRLGVVLDRRYEPSRLAAAVSLCDRAGIDVLVVQERSLPDEATPFEEAVALAARARRAAVAVERRLEIVLSGEQPDEPPGRIVSVILRRVDEVDGVPAAVRVADGVLVPEALLPSLPRACQEAGREANTLRVAVELALSIGRTSAEARARAEAESWREDIGAPEVTGVFGTLEDGQRRVQALARAGVTDLWCHLPRCADVHDVIAQMTALPVGTLGPLRAEEERSPAPAPPRDWGGRPRRS